MEAQLKNLKIIIPVTAAIVAVAAATYVFVSSGNDKSANSSSSQNSDLNSGQNIDFSKINACELFPLEAGREPAD